MATAQYTTLETSGDSTPEYIAVKKSLLKIQDEAKSLKESLAFILHGAELIKTEDENVVKAVLADISQTPLTYYALQQALANADDRFQGIVANMASIWLGEFPVIIVLSHTFCFFCS